MYSLIDMDAQTFKKQTNTLSMTFGRKVSQYIHLGTKIIFHRIKYV